MRIIFLLLLICTACARQIPLTGGLKDVKSPEVLNYQPANKSLNFKGTQISIEFDEYIKEENLLNQLLITPRIKGTYKSKVNKNKLTLTFDEPFDSLTTYTLNFREGIKDITENNVPENLQYVFSTGSYLDSISISGKVQSLMTFAPLKDISISLYRPNDSITIFNGPPLYSTITKENGTYALENIKYGRYLIFAINDKNKNFKLESADESYAFLNSVQLLEDSLPNVVFKLQNLDTRKPVLQSSRPVGINYDLKFNKYITSYSISTDRDISFNSNLVDNNKTLRIYNNLNLTDSVALSFVVQDSSLQQIDSVVYVKFQESTRKPDKVTSNFELDKGPINKTFETQLKVNKPIARINYDSIYFKFDSVAQIPLPSKQMKLNYSKDLLEFSISMDSIFAQDSTIRNWESNFELVLAKGSITTIEQDTLSIIRRELNIKKTEEYGLLAGTINTAHSFFTVQLINADFEIIEQQSFSTSSDKQYQFKNVSPGEYSIRVLVDSNENGIWDIGNISESKLAEPTYLFFHPNVTTEVITIRANWEQTGVDLTF